VPFVRLAHRRLKDGLDASEHVVDRVQTRIALCKGETKMSKEVSQLIDDLTHRRISRRTFIIQAAALGLTVGSISSILTACGGSAATPTTAPAEAPTSAPAAAPTTAPAESTPAAATAKQPNDGKKWRVGVLHISPATTGGWDPNHHRGYTAAAEKLGWDVTIAENVDYARGAEVMRGYGANNYDLICATSGGFGDVLKEVAPEFPKTEFAMVSDMDNTANIPNLCGFTIYMPEIGYLMGSFAALASKSKTIGISSGTPIYSCEKMMAGIVHGVAALQPDWKVEVNYSGDWNDQAKVQQSGLALVDKGATVLVQIHTAGELAIFQVAKQKGLMATSYFTDHGDEYPGVVGSGPAWDTPTVYGNLFQAVMNGTVESKIYPGHVKDDLIGLLPSHNLIPADKEAQLEQIKADMKSGKLVIADYEPYTVGAQ
jgi:basic membrane protein A and related proteins